MGTLCASENSSTNRIHLFTVFQLVCLGILYALKSIKAVAVVFPFFIASLVFIRWGFKKFFTEEELEALDGHGGEEEDEIPATDPESPLKRKATPEDPTVQMKAVGEVVSSQLDNRPSRFSLAEQPLIPIPSPNLMPSRFARQCNSQLCFI